MRALLPVATLYVGKLIIDEVVLLALGPHVAEDLRQWIASGLLDRIGSLLALEFGLAVLSDVLGRVVSIGQLFAQAQDVVTVASFAAGLVVNAPWLIALLAIALLPAFIGEAHFNAQSYSLNYARTPERRELDYVRQTGASAETAKEVKIFGLHAFLIERYRTLATSFFACLHARRAASDPRRATGRARRAGGVRAVQALQGIEPGQDGGVDIAPVFQRPHGGPHRDADGRRRRGHGYAPRTSGARRAVCGTVRIAAAGYR